MKARFYDGEHSQPMIEIQPDNSTTVSRPATPDDRRAFPAEWAAYQANTPPEGGIPGAPETPEAPTGLEAVSGIGPKSAADLNNVGIHTLEELAALDEAAIDELPVSNRKRTLILEEWQPAARALLA